MDKINKLGKLVFLLEKHEKNLHQKAIQCKARLDEEQRKYDLLKGCLDDYREKLKANNLSIQSFRYQHYQTFFQQLENAILQQTDVVARTKAVHQKWLKDIEMAKKKLESMHKLIAGEKAYIQHKMDKKEMQMATDLFNRINKR
ncbi:MAG: flagellar export protein FliJ [Candidatus Berkiella sp.]